MKRGSAGVTLLELIIALVIGGVLVSISLSGALQVRGKFAVKGARTSYATMQQRARAKAVEKGETILFIVNTVGDSAYIWSVSEGGTTDVVNFDREFNVDVKGSSSAYLLCMTPRGYADYNCGGYSGIITATMNTAFKLEFWQNADSVSVLVLPMGQLVGL